MRKFLLSFAEFQDRVEIWGHWFKRIEGKYIYFLLHSILKAYLLFLLLYETADEPVKLNRLRDAFYYFKKKLILVSYTLFTGEFGNGVLSYFKFLKWLWLLNIYIFILMTLFVVIPQAVFKEDLDYSGVRCKII